jgi:hypothetical protein
MSFMRAVGRQECKVEREALWGITKLRVEGSRAIDVREAVVAWAKWAGVGS